MIVSFELCLVGRVESGDLGRAIENKCKILRCNGLNGYHLES